VCMAVVSHTQPKQSMPWEGTRVPPGSQRGAPRTATRAAPGTPHSRGTQALTGGTGQPVTQGEVFSRFHRGWVSQWVPAGLAVVAAVVAWGMGGSGGRPGKMLARSGLGSVVWWGEHGHGMHAQAGDLRAPGRQAGCMQRMAWHVGGRDALQVVGQPSKKVLLAVGWCCWPCQLKCQFQALHVQCLGLLLAAGRVDA